MTQRINFIKIKLFLTFLSDGSAKNRPFKKSTTSHVDFLKVPIKIS
jgi:hypothetical protein